jgi:hypothetical protein
MMRDDPGSSPGGVVADFSPNANVPRLVRGIQLGADFFF